jgi:AcrR family transcriptional regulator
MEAAQLAPGSADRPRHIQILDEAARMFNVRGVSSKPLSDLAERLSLSRAALYYYVKDREDLIFQVYRRTCEILDQSLTAAQSERRDAIRVVQAFVALALDPEAPDVSALGELGLLRPHDRETVLGHFEQIVGRLAGVLEEGQIRGEVRPCDTMIAARTILSIIMSIPTNTPWAMAAQGPVMGERRLQIAMAQAMLADGWLVDRSRRIDPPPIDLTPVALPMVGAFDRKALAEAKREAILVAASRLFNRKGMDSTSLDEIAAAVGATKRTLYQHVGDKLALSMACVRRSARLFHYVFAEAVRCTSSEVLRQLGSGFSGEQASSGVDI